SHLPRLWQQVQPSRQPRRQEREVQVRRVDGCAGRNSAAPAPPVPAAEFIQVQCSNEACRRTLKVPAKFAGKTGKCPGCGKPIPIPLSGAGTEGVPQPRKPLIPEEEPAPSPEPARADGDESEPAPEAEVSAENGEADDLWKESGLLQRN